MALVDTHTQVEVEPKRDLSPGPKTPSAISVKNVLFAADFSVTSEAALPYATAICRRFGSTLHLVHVLSDTSLLMMTGGVDYVSMSTIYEDAHTEAKEKLDAELKNLEAKRKETAALLDEAEVSLPQAGSIGHKATYRLTNANFFGRRQVSRSEAYVFCYAGGKWTVEYRFDYPDDYDAGSAIAGFMRDLDWTIREQP